MKETKTKPINKKSEAHRKTGVVVVLVVIVVVVVVVTVHRGMPGGEENGQRGYMLTFVIAYLRVCTPSGYLFGCYLNNHIISSNNSKYNSMTSTLRLVGWLLNVPLNTL